MKNKGEVKCLDCKYRCKVEDPRTTNGVTCKKCSSENVTFVCGSCGKYIDSVYTAYLQNRDQRSGLCANCKDMVEEEDLDKVTFECFEKLCHVVNGGSAKGLAESMFRTIRRQHRYLQNEFFTALWKFFELYGAQDKNHRDARNEWAVSVAKRWNENTFD